MGCQKLGFVLLGLSAVLWAADPFVGTWKLNSAKSKYTTGQPPKEQTIVIGQEGESLDVKITGTASDGTPVSSHYIIPVAGGKGTVKESRTHDAVSSKRVDANTRENSYFKEGKQVFTVRVSVAKDGKTLTSTVKGTGPLGKPVEGVVVFDKQ